MVMAMMTTTTIIATIMIIILIVIAINIITVITITTIIITTTTIFIAFIITRFAPLSAAYHRHKGTVTDRWAQLESHRWPVTRTLRV